MQWSEPYANDSRWNSGRVASDERERLCSRYASGALQIIIDISPAWDEPGSSSTPVSSRYSFAGLLCHIANTKLHLNVRSFRI